MNELKRIIQITEPYLNLIDSGNPPSFKDLMQKYIARVNNDPGCLELAWLTFLMVELYSAEFIKEINIACRPNGFPSPVIFS